MIRLHGGIVKGVACNTASYTRENIAAIDRSRRARILACAVGEQLRRGVGDLELLAETEDWTELRTRLMEK
ncbi:hypothetical protein [Streptomyces sp. NPDC051286]|uniref:hypothetical protein n=1 Tax=Streptomyces sp. NPDC051286 TaxID=3365647 RepID=UPI0037B50A72